MLNHDKINIYGVSCSKIGEYLTLYPTISTLKKQAQGPIGSLQRLQNSLSAVKKQFGKSLDEISIKVKEAVSAWVISLNAIGKRCKSIEAEQGN